jgi:hypothetical protein
VRVRGNFEYVLLGFQGNKPYSKSNGNLIKSQSINVVSPHHPISASTKTSLPFKGRAGVGMGLPYAKIEGSLNGNNYNNSEGVRILREVLPLKCFVFQVTKVSTSWLISRVQI